ncbi:MAG: biliverdin-producing heme oxygenase [Hyphomicrobium sp.]|nr:biliverdin-producing heme oxygenase [Hyphomicrobium sp.]
MGKRRDHLRAATACDHQRLDQKFATINMSEDYARCLIATHALRSAIEPWLSAHPLSDEAFRPTFALKELSDDCADLGLSVSGSTFEVPFEPTKENWFGALYVMEGSSLGAPVLMSMARKLGYDGSFGARHLAVQLKARQTWRQFIDIFEEVPGLDISASADTARKLFSIALSHK